VSWRLTREAESDLIEILIQGTRQFGRAQAEHYHDLLARCFEFLAENPKAARRRTEITPPIRIHPIQSHLILYQIEPGGNILVLRVRHAHEDWADE